MRELLIQSFRAAVDAADARTVLAAHLPRPPSRGRTLVVGAGKAAGSMAQAVERHWPKDASLQGLALTRYGHALPAGRIRIVEAGHPLPDAAGEAGTREMLAQIQALGHGDLLLALVSGGGSSLLSLPAEGVLTEELRVLTSALLRCGATIQEINTVRKHLSATLGGRLAAACKAPIVALIVSDVTGDDPTHIASGPCAPDPSTYRDALEVLVRYGVQAPGSIAEHLARGAQGKIDETPKPGDPVFARVENHVIATAHRSLEAAAGWFGARGIRPVILGDTVTGEASEVAKVMAALVREARGFGGALAPPLALISGGECSVTVRNASGRGGRCAEFLLALAVELDGLPRVHAIAADTDGIDGSEDNAGALIAPDSLARAAALGLVPRKCLAANDSYAFFDALDDLVVTGPTYTNVNDYRAIVVS
ncbi:MAG: glycerate kinase [Betaproteobacteria bacterium]|nr:glycerate kinase [Betaproteobacteria bacterium]